jgi:hypothetical protein
VDDKSALDEQSFEVRVLTGGDEALWTLQISRPEGWYDCWSGSAMVATEPGKHKARISSRL